MSKTPATDWYQDDRPELWDDEERPECEVCGDEGVVGWFDHPEYHGDDCAEGLEDHLIECPECVARRARQSRATAGDSGDPQEGVGDAPQEVRPKGP